MHACWGAFHSYTCLMQPIQLDIQLSSYLQHFYLTVLHLYSWLLRAQLPVCTYAYNENDKENTVIMKISCIISLLILWLHSQLQEMCYIRNDCIQLASFCSYTIDTTVSMVQLAQLRHPSSAMHMQLQTPCIQLQA